MRGVVGCWLVLSLPPLSPTEKYRVTDSPLLKPLPFHIYCCPFPAPALLPHLIQGNSLYTSPKEQLDTFSTLILRCFPFLMSLCIPNSLIRCFLYLLLRWFLYCTFYSGAFYTLPSTQVLFFPYQLMHSQHSYQVLPIHSYQVLSIPSILSAFPSLLAVAFLTFLSSAFSTFFSFFFPSLWADAFPTSYKVLFQRSF